MFHVAKKNVYATLLSIGLLGNLTMVSCGDNPSPNSNSVANSVPTTVNTMVMEGKSYTLSVNTPSSPFAYATCVKSGTIGLFITGQNNVAVTNLVFGSELPTTTTTYKVTSNTLVILPNEVVVISQVNTQNSNGSVTYRRAGGKSGTVTVSLEGGKMVAKYSGVSADVSEGAIGIGAGSAEKPAGTTTLAGYMKCL